MRMVRGGAEEVAKDMWGRGGGEHAEARLRAKSQREVNYAIVA